MRTDNSGACRCSERTCTVQRHWIHVMLKRCVCAAIEYSIDPRIIKIWSMEGGCIQELHGHTSFVYQVSVSEQGDIASCSEDRSVKIWRSLALLKI